MVVEELCNLIVVVFEASIKVDLPITLASKSMAKSEIDITSREC